MRNIRPTFSASILAKLYRLSRACMSRAIQKTASGIGAGFQARAECLRWASARKPAGIIWVGLVGKIRLSACADTRMSDNPPQ